MKSLKKNKNYLQEEDIKLVIRELSNSKETYKRLNENITKGFLNFLEKQKFNDEEDLILFLED